MDSMVCFLSTVFGRAVEVVNRPLVTVNVDNVRSPQLKNYELLVVDQ